MVSVTTAETWYLQGLLLSHTAGLFFFCALQIELVLCNVLVNFTQDSNYLLAAIEIKWGLASSLGLAPLISERYSWFLVCLSLLGDSSQLLASSNIWLPVLHTFRCCDLYTGLHGWEQESSEGPCAQRKSAECGVQFPEDLSSCSLAHTVLQTSLKMCDPCQAKSQKPEMWLNRCFSNQEWGGFSALFSSWSFSRLAKKKKKNAKQEKLNRHNKFTYCTGNRIQVYLVWNFDCLRADFVFPPCYEYT